MDYTHYEFTCDEGNTWPRHCYPPFVRTIIHQEKLCNKKNNSGLKYLIKKPKENTQLNQLVTVRRIQTEYGDKGDTRGIHFIMLRPSWFSPIQNNEPKPRLEEILVWLLFIWRKILIIAGIECKEHVQDGSNILQFKCSKPKTCACTQIYWNVAVATSKQLEDHGSVFGSHLMRVGEKKNQFWRFKKLVLNPFLSTKTGQCNDNYTHLTLTHTISYNLDRTNSRPQGLYIEVLMASGSLIKPFKEHERPDGLYR